MYKVESSMLSVALRNAEACTEDSYANNYNLTGYEVYYRHRQVRELYSAQNVRGGAREEVAPELTLKRY